MLIAFVNNYDDDVTKREILNATETKMTTVDIKETSVSDLGLKIFPNPVSTKGFAEFSLKQTSNITMTILNNLGQVVSETKGECYAAGTHLITFDTGFLPAGVYLLELRANDGRMVKTFVK